MAISRQTIDIPQPIYDTADKAVCSVFGISYMQQSTSVNNYNHYSYSDCHYILIIAIVQHAGNLLMTEFTKTNVNEKN